MLVVSYNPGYQNILKSLKPSTRQRFLAVEFDFPPPEREAEIVARESGLPLERCRPLVRLAGTLRDLKGQDLEEGVSTRLLVYCASLIAAGVAAEEAVLATMIEPLTDELDVKQALIEVARAATDISFGLPASGMSERRTPIGIAASSARNVGV